jgi:dienelactone hydrolase
MVVIPEAAHVNHGIDAFRNLLLSLVIAFAAASNAFAQQTTTIEYLTLETTSPSRDPAKPVLLSALLYVPANVELPIPAVVITPSSGGVRNDVEIHYASALARAGIAALVIDSFAARGVAHTIHDQRLVDSWDMVKDAIAGLRLLLADKRFRSDRIGVMGVSKGGIVAMNTALTSVLKWAGASGIQFAAHVAIVPHCGWIPRALATTQSPLLFLLAELDDQCPPADCVSYAERLRGGGNPNIEVNTYRGAYHAWEIIGEKPYFDKWAENFSRCRAIIDEDGSSTAEDGTLIRAEESRAWAEANCITLGTWCCGGNEAQKKRSADDVVAFLRRNGF